MSETGSHDEFLELCAVSTSGQLTEAEEQKLQAHLADCPACRETLKQYQAMVDRVIPAMAPEEISDDLEPGPNWSMERAEQSLFKQISREEKPNRASAKTKAPTAGPKPTTGFPTFMAATWRNVWQLYVAGIILFVTLGALVYQVGCAAVQLKSRHNHPSKPGLLQIRVRSKHKSVMLPMNGKWHAWRRSSETAPLPISAGNSSYGPLK